MVDFIIVHVLAQKLIFDVIAVAVDYMLMSGCVRRLAVKLVLLDRSAVANTQWTVDLLWQTGKRKEGRKRN